MAKDINFSKIFLIRQGKLDVVKAWMDELKKNRRQEAITTLTQEGLSRELYALFTGNDGNSYIIGITESDGEIFPTDMTIQINKEHKLFKADCLIPFSNNGELLLDLKTG